MLEQNKVLQIAYKDQTIINFNGKHLTILVTGCSGFIGSHLVYRLLKEAKNGAYEVRCMTRSLKSIEGLFGNESNKDLKFVSADASKYSDLVKVMTGVNIAFYLIHSMEGSSKNWKKFAERDRVAASNFARAATKCGVERIIYLGGLVHENEGEQQDKLSEHMQSRLEVGKILTESTAKVTIFRAAIIIGQGGGSYQMLRYLVERLPVMVCPKWVLTRSQPIALDDVITYLIKSIESKETEGRSFDLGGPILFLSLVLLAAIGSTYYMIGIRPELLNISWLVLDGLWYFGIAFSIFFIRNGARLGAITAGAIGWITLAFWTLDSIYTVSENPIISNSFSMEVIIRNFIGIFIAILVVASSHNVFHKIRIYGL